MKKVLLFSFLFSCIIGKALSQTQLTNSTFELWDNIAASTAEPQEWSSNKTGTGFATLGGQTCFPEATIVHGGSYSVKLTTISSGFGSNVNGVVTCGRVNAPDTNPAHGYNNTLQANALYNMPFTGRPDSIVFWMRYSPGAGDSARVSCMLHSAYDQKDPPSLDANTWTNVIGYAIKNFGTTAGGWVRFALPFVYANGSTPAYCLTTFTSTKVPGGGSTSSVAYVDDVTMIYNPSGTAGPVNPLTYYVSASQGAAIAIPFTLNAAFNPSNTVTAQLSDASGSFAAPVVLGTLTNTNTSGTINGTIPAGTVTGSGYRVRITCTSPNYTSVDNGADIQIYLVNNSVSPNTAQGLEAGVNGTTLNVTENIAATSREWKYGTAPGGPYISFAPTETGTSYIPNFASSGTYYVICESTWPGALTSTSNEVMIVVVDNAVTPSASQSILVMTNGTLLTVTETPSGTAREWKYGTAPGGPYVSFAPTETGMTYLPYFTLAGTYYVVCQSTISGIVATSNEVLINVGTVTLTTGTVLGSPFEFSPNAPDASVNVPFTVSAPLVAGNIFTAELSDATGSFAAPVSIGTLNGINSGTIAATISHLTVGGTGYRIRVTATNPAILGSDNGVDLVIDQFSNSVAPGTTQTIPHSTNGTTITVTPSQSSTQEWKYSTIPGGPYASFAPTETATTYVPYFTTPGTYYVACVSVNQYADPVTSNEVQVDVTNGSTLNTSPVTSPFYLSSNAVVNSNVDFTTDIIFNAGNIFTAQISDIAGSFAFPTTIGTLSGPTPGTISGLIPNNLSDGVGYRIRVVSSDPVSIGTDNGTDLEVIQLSNAVSPDTIQNLLTSTMGTTITVSCTHIAGAQIWKWRTFATTWADFTPAETGTTYTPIFATADNYYVKCFSVNAWGDTAESQEVIIVVTDPAANDEAVSSNPASVFFIGDELNVIQNHAEFHSGKIELLDAQGRVVFSGKLSESARSAFHTSISGGIYFFSLRDKNKVQTGKIFKF